MHAERRDALGIESAHVVGVSMGGMIVQTFALAHPDRLRFLVIASVGPGGSHQVTAGDAFADLEESAGEPTRTTTAN